MGEDITEGARAQMIPRSGNGSPSDGVTEKLNPCHCREDRSKIRRAPFHPTALRGTSGTVSASRILFDEVWPVNPSSFGRTAQRFVRR